VTGRAEVLTMLAVGHEHGSGDLARTVLDGVSLTVLEGELVAVMGASGSGKSTLLAVAGGLTTPTTGHVQVDGTWLGDLTPAELARVRRRSIGFVFQQYNLVSTLTAAENVALPLELDGISTRAARRAADDALAGLGLAGRGRAFPAELSGGEQQRVAIARAVVGSRRLVLADEPTGALDSTTGDEVMALLRDRVDAGAAGLLVTHDARHAAWADRIVFLRDGRLVDESSPRGPESLLRPEAR
jgi:putative ABC transport system ATP-binding protein